MTTKLREGCVRDVDLHESMVIGSARLAWMETALHPNDRHDQQRINLLRLAHRVDDLSVLLCLILFDVRR